MTNINWIFLLLVTVQQALSDDLLAKFHQHTYKIKDVRMQLISYNENYFYFLKFKPFKFNRTITAHNWTYRCKVEMQNKVEVVVQVFKFLSNEYRHFPVRYQININRAFETNAIGLKAGVKCGNSTSGYVHKDVTYHVCNFAIDETHFPPLFPNGRYRTDLEFTYLDQTITFLHYYSELYNVDRTFRIRLVWCGKLLPMYLNYFITIMLVVLVKDISCDDLLSKFHQHGYKIKDVRIQLINYNKNYFYFFQFKPFKFNRTTTAHNSTFRCKVEMQDKMEVVVQLYKFLSNEYRHFPVRYQVNFYKAFEANAIGLKDAAKCGNVTSFYVHKDVTYHVCNFAIDESRFPPLFPNGRYRSDLEIVYLDIKIALLHFYSEVYTPMEYPKK